MGKRSPHFSKGIIPNSFTPSLSDKRIFNPHAESETRNQTGPNALLCVFYPSDFAYFFLLKLFFTPTALLSTPHCFFRMNFPFVFFSLH